MIRKYRHLNVLIWLICVFLIVSTVWNCGKIPSDKGPLVLDTLVHDSIRVRVKQFPISGDTTFRLRQEGNWDLKLERLNPNLFKFEKIKRASYQHQPFDEKRYETVSDSILDELSHYPNIISIADSCIVIKVAEPELKHCIKDYGNSYTASKSDKGYVTVNLLGYESITYFLINPQLNRHALFFSTPIFLNDTLVYTVVGYYGDGHLAIWDAKNDKKFDLDTYNWDIINYYIEDRQLFVEFFYFPDNRLKKYFRIKLN